ncbi:hypothetical protein ACFT2C_06410 [Promicromonospora sp. NPDC057138]|uniref:hypothetical protein n=1 Tax=Promicromonospora sp. NPDC057138 TaxID=3346031 RepID=UPI0036309DFB
MPGHDVFLCYDPATDERFAHRFGAHLATFGRRRSGPGPRRAALRLAPRTADALAASDWLVLLASPEAARSPQVIDEVERWLDRHGTHSHGAHSHGTDRILIGLTRGDLRWAGDRAADGTDTLPSALLARLTTEPHWVDLRDIAGLDRLDRGNALVSENLATFAARLRGVEKDQLIGAHVRRERRTRRATVAAGAVLSVLLGVALVLAVLAFRGAHRADTEARAADARLLASTALAVSDTDAERAVLLAAEGYRLHPDTQTFTALLRSVEATGPLERRVDLGGDVVALAAAPLPEEPEESGSDPEAGADAGTVVAGTADGDVWRWRLDRAPELLATLEGAVTEVATSADGETVAAVAEGALWVSTAHPGSPGPGTTGLAGVSDVAVDPDGERLAAIVWDTTDHELLLLDGTGRTRIASDDLTGTSLEAVALTEDALVVAQRRVPSGAGHWQRRSVPDLEIVREAGVVEPLDGEFTEHQVSPDGALVTAFRAGSVFAADTTSNALYRMAAPDSLGSLLPVTAAPSGGEAARMLLSRRDETWVVELPSWTYERAWQLRGMPTADAAVFLDDDRLVTAHGGTLAAWDLASASPLTSSVDTDRAYLADTALSPDGTRVTTGGASLLDGSGRWYDAVSSYLLTGQDGRTGRTDDRDSTDQDLRSVIQAVQPGRLGDRLLPVPLDDGRVLVVTPEDGTVSEATGSLSDDDLTTPVPLRPLEARYETGLRSVRAARVVGDRLVLADAFGRVQVRDARGGRLVRHATADHAATSDPWAVEAAISPDGRYVAFHDLSPLAFGTEEATVSVLDLRISRTRTLTVPVRQNVTHLGLRTSAPVLDLTYGGDHLLASQVDGVLVVEPDGSAVRTTIDSVVGSTAAFTPSALAPVPGTSLVAQAGELDWIRLYDTRTGQQVGSLTPPEAGGTLDPLWLAAGPDSLLALSGDDAVRWDLRPAALLDAACAFAARDLTVAEWTQAVGSAAPGDLACDRDL